MDIGSPLANKTIVITRPERQAEEISKRLRCLGANVIVFPLIAIEASTEKNLTQEKLSKISEYDYLIFTSRNAVEMTFAALASPESPLQTLALFKTKQIAAVGKQTAEALQLMGVSASIVPTAKFNSEALLEHSALQEVATKRISIIRGEGGRDLLRSTLVERGAEVDYIDVYRRVCPVTDLFPLVKCQKQFGIDIIVLTSVEGLQNLLKLGADQHWLKHIPLLAGSQRILEAVIATGHHGKVIHADDPSDDQVLNCLLNWASCVD